MRKVAVELAMLVRQTKTVIVEVPDDCTATDEDIADAAWLADDGVGFEDNVGWGCQVGTHSVLPGEPELAPDYSIETRDGSTIAVRSGR